MFQIWIISTAFILCSVVFLGQVKEHKVKQVIEMAPPLCSENMLLAESSFVPGLETKSAANGYRLEWIEKMPQNFLPPQDVDSEVGSCVLCKYQCLGFVATISCLKENLGTHTWPLVDIFCYQIGGMEDPFRAKRQKVYAYAHSFNINSISNNRCIRLPFYHGCLISCFCQ